MASTTPPARTGGTSGQPAKASPKSQLMPRDDLSWPSSFLFERPFTMMQRLTEEMDRHFSEIFGPRSAMGGSVSSPSIFGGGMPLGRWQPQIEVLEKDNQLLVRADLPGMMKDDIQIEVQDDTLLISGERRSEHTESREGLHHSERRYGQFMRSVQLPDGVDADQIKARFDNGVLEVCMPCPPRKASGRRVAIEDASARQAKKKEGGEGEERTLQ